MKVGIDFGGVIVKASEGEDFNSSDGLQIEVKNAIDTIKILGRKNEIFIISKASPRVQIFTREWLSVVGFYQRTGFRPENLFFCEKRKEKSRICSQLKIDCFIDDSFEVIESLVTIVKTPIHFSESINKQKILAINNWNEILNEITS